MLKTNYIGPYNFNHGLCKAGFFSTCSVRLHNIIKYFNVNKFLPITVDSSEHFRLYKSRYENENNIDIIFEYFKHYNDYEQIKFENTVVDYDESYQFSEYSSLDYERINPFIKKYFSPSHDIKQLVVSIETKYNINDYTNICVLFYRGNDKATETNVSPYEEVIVKAKKILDKVPTIQFLIQSDETEFIERMTSTFPKNSFYFKDEIRHINKDLTTVDLIDTDDNMKNREFSKRFLAITIIMSKCKYVVCGSSGNCSIWITFFRGNANNVIHYLRNGVWVGDTDL